MQRVVHFLASSAGQYHFSLFPVQVPTGWDQKLNSQEKILSDPKKTCNRCVALIKMACSSSNLNANYKVKLPRMQQWEKNIYVLVLNLERQICLFRVLVMSQACEHISDISQENDNVCCNPTVLKRSQVLGKFSSISEMKADSIVCVFMSLLWNIAVWYVILD